MLSGAEGDDILYGFEGDDTIFGGDGQDRIFGDAGNDLIHTQNENKYNFKTSFKIIVNYINLKHNESYN